MRESSPNATPSVTDSPAPRAQADGREASTTADRTESELVVMSHEELFVEVPASLCDACAQPFGANDVDDGYRIPGRGVYLWARGEETRLESVPLCASCASAIGMTALGRWEIEEEEG